MASRNPVTITGNLAGDPEPFGENGAAGVRITVVENIGYRNRQSGEFVDDQPVFWPVAIWSGSLADNVAATLRKGDRVTVVGRYRNNVWGEGEDRRSRLELSADEVSASLRFATATLSRNSRARADEAPELASAPF